MLLRVVQLYVVFHAVFQTANSQAIHQEKEDHIKEKMHLPNAINEQLQSNDLIQKLKKQIPDVALNAFNQDIGQQNSQIQLFLYEVSKLKQDIIRLENDNSKHKEELSHLKTQLKSQELYSHDQLHSFKTQSFDKIQDLNNAMLKHMEKMNSFVSFTAYGTEDTDCNSDDVVLFDGIVVNYGGFYDSTTSIFTCPFSGFYMFSVSVRAEDEHTISVGIMVGGTRLISALAQDGTSYGQGSALLVTRCDEGQDVLIRCGNGNYRMEGSGSRFSSFTGTLLRII